MNLHIENQSRWGDKSAPTERFVITKLFCESPLSGPVPGRSLHCLFKEGSACKLAVVQIGIEAILCQQFLVGSFLDDCAVIHDEDQIGVADGGEAVGYHKVSPALHQLGHSLLNLH